MKLALFALLAALIAACASPPVKTRPVDGHSRAVRTIGEFFERTADDLRRASVVVIENDLVKNITHLQTMNSGGDRYYLLERENLTTMIRSVTQGVYVDCILINREGVVVYTMHNDRLFGKNVRTTLKNTLLIDCYENRHLPVFVSDVTVIPGDGERRSILVSMKLSGGKTMPGVLVLQIDTTRIAEIIGDTVCVGADGNYRVHRSAAMINTPYPGDTAAGTPFTFANLRWLLFTDR